MGSDFSRTLKSSVRASLHNGGVTPAHALTASHLTRRFGSRLAVDEVSFDVGAGEVLALLGPNGAGKTTTLRMLAGVIAPTSGTVHVGGLPLTAEAASPLRRRIGVLTEAPGLWDRLTVTQNLYVYARLYGLAEPAAVCADILQRFGLREHGDQLAAQLSKGLKQRVAIARALLHRPSILLLDEPTSGLDPAMALTVRRMILELRAEGCAVVLSTHNLDEVDRVADRVAVLRTQLVAVDTPATLRSRLFGPRLTIHVIGSAATFVPAVREFGEVSVEGEGTLHMTLRDFGSTPEIVRRLTAAGADIASVVPEEPPLEDVYLRLLGDGSDSRRPDS